VTLAPTTQLAAYSLPLLAVESTFQGVQSSALGEVLVVIAALLIIAKIFWDAVDRVRGGASQKREVSFSNEYATVAQFRELQEEVRKLDAERRTSVANLHVKIDHLSERLDKRIDEIPARTIQLLNETKQLHGQ
jgi:hypothetical protein